MGEKKAITPKDELVLRGADVHKQNQNKVEKIRKEIRNAESRIAMERINCKHEMKICRQATLQESAISGVYIIYDAEKSIGIIAIKSTLIFLPLA